jgi:glycosyltransferase involved in cell wall biosynthesis
LVSLFHLDSWRRKGFEQLVRAAVAAAANIDGLTIDVYGTGAARSIRAAEAVISRHRAALIVRLMGAAPHDQVQSILNGYTGFVMAPHRETYGMVHVEALLAGLPILWSKDRGVDGFFENHDVGYRADPTSVADVARGIRTLVEREQSLKVNIAHLQRNGAFEHLRRHSIAKTYTNILLRHADPAPEERRIAS